MRSHHFAALAACLSLAACGGGGVNSTPTPTPKPTPPPTNSAFTDLKANQSFATSAATGNTAFPKSGAAPSNAIAGATLIVAYDATASSYTISAADRTQSFLPADLDKTNSTTRLSIYTKAAAGTTDSFTLTKPGTSGRNYQYVAGGLWQRSVDGTASTSGSLDAVTFGFTTPDSAVPRTGRIEYAVDLLGAETTTTNVFALNGQGLVQIDFASGAVITHGTLTAAVVGSTVFSSEALLSSTSNAFSGNFRFDDSGLFTGSFSGSLFGPQAQELGGTFKTAQADGRIAVGAIIGRGAAFAGTNVSLVSPVTDEFFTNDAAEMKATLSAAHVFSAQSQASTPLLVNYDGTRLKYTLMASDRSQYFATPSQQNDTLTFLAPTGFQYVRGGEWRHVMTQNGASSYAIDDFTYGVETVDGALPRTGIAGFAAQVSGSAADGDYSNLVNFSGKGSVTVDFAAGKLALSAGVHYVSEAPAGSSAVANGKLLANATLSSTSNAFTGAATMDGIGAYSGTLDGRFYGPAATELGGAFHLSEVDGGGVVTGVATGVIVAQQDADVLSVLPTLAALPSLTTFDDSRYLLLGQGSPVLSSQSTLVYDPQSKVYTFNATGDGVVQAQARFAPGDLQAGQSDANYAYYASTSADSSVVANAKILKSGAPKIALSFTSFADINLSVTNGTTTVTEYYYPFGVSTPPEQLPQYGTGTYAGIVYGKGRVVDGTTHVTSRYTLDGTSKLVVDFGAGTFADMLSITGVDSVTSATTNFHDFVARGTLSSAGVMTGDFATNGTSGYRGTFNGPQAAEYGSAFTINQTNPDNTVIGLNGAAVGKKLP